MSYHKPLEGTLDQLLSCGKGVVGTAVGGLSDPHLAEIVCRLEQLKALSTNRTIVQAMFGKKPTVFVPPCRVTVVKPGTKGLGLEAAALPLRKLVYVNQHPTVAWAAITGVLAIPFVVGYLAGRRRKL